MAGMFGDVTKAIAEVTELKRLVAILAARLEANTSALDRNSALIESLERKLRNDRTA